MFRVADLAVGTAGGAGATGIHVGPHHWKHGWIPLTPEAAASHAKRVRGWHAPRVRREDHMGARRGVHAFRNEQEAQHHHGEFLAVRGMANVATRGRGPGIQRQHLEDRHGLVGGRLAMMSPTELEKLHGAEHGLRPATARERTAGPVNTGALRLGQHVHGAAARTPVRSRVPQPGERTGNFLRGQVPAVPEEDRRMAIHLAAKHGLAAKLGHHATNIQAHRAQHRQGRFASPSKEHMHADPSTAREITKAPSMSPSERHLRQHMIAKHDAGVAQLAGKDRRDLELAHKADHQRNGFAAARRAGRNPVNHAHGSEAGAPTIPFRERMQRDRAKARGVQAERVAQMPKRPTDVFREQVQARDAAARRAMGSAPARPDLEAAGAALRAQRSDHIRNAGRPGGYRARQHVIRHREDAAAHLRQVHGVEPAKGSAAQRRQHALEHGLQRAPAAPRGRARRGRYQPGGYAGRGGMAGFGGPMVKGAPDVGDKDGIAGEGGRTPENIAAGTDPGAKEFHSAVQEAIRSGIRERKSTGEGLGGTEWITFNNGARYHFRHLADPNDPRPGRAREAEDVLRGAGRGAQGSGHDILAREIVANNVARAMGVHAARIETVDLSPGRGRPDVGNLQEVLPGHHGGGINSEEGRRIAILDHVLANSDRHGRNYLAQPNGQAVAIDHGLMFNPKFTRGRQAFRDQHEGTFNVQDAAAARAAIAPFERQIRKHAGPNDSWENVQARITQLGQYGVQGR